MVEESVPKSKGELYEGVAFTFCKAATIILITGKLALPIAAGAASILYVMAHLHGKHDTRCVLRTPLLTAAFWGTVAVLAVYFMTHPWR